MKGIGYLLLSVFFLFPTDVFAQYQPWWQWAITDTAISSAQSGPEHVLAARNHRILWGRLRNNKRMAGTVIMGDYILGEYDTLGKSTGANIGITGKLRLIDAQADVTGNWYILGQYYDTLRIGAQSPFVRNVAAGAIEPEYFILKLNAGSLAVSWLQFIGHTNQLKSSAFTVANNQLYVAVDSVNESQVWSMNLLNGTPVTVLRQGGASSTSSIQVDVGGNIYLAGSCGGAGIRFGTTIQAPVAGNHSPSYIVRYRANGAYHWHHWMYDVNCVNRKLTLAHRNSIYYSGDLNDSMRIGSTVLQRPIPVHDYVAARLDSNGAVAWARQMDGSGGEANISHAYHAVVTPDSALVLFAQTNQYVNWSPSVGTDAFNTYGATAVSIGPNGVARWAKIALGQVTTNQHIATDGDAVWVAGNGFTNSNVLIFDTLRLNVKPQTYVPYLAKIKLTPPPPPVISGVGAIRQLPVQIAPNPAHSSLSVSGLAALQAPAVITLTEMTGKVLLRRELKGSAGAVTIDVSAFPRGIFFVEIRSGELRNLEKVVLE